MSRHKSTGILKPKSLGCRVSQEKYQKFKKEAGKIQSTHQKIIEEMIDTFLDGKIELC